MPKTSDIQIEPPDKWQDFENLCFKLWKSIWADPGTQKAGRKGQSQDGVDVFGRPDQREKISGIQCRSKDKYLKQKLTIAELTKAVKEAKAFEPKLSEFIIATTSPRDAKLQEKARKITQKHIKEGLFTVSVVGWEDIKLLLDDYPNLALEYCIIQTSSKPPTDRLTQFTKEALSEKKKTSSSLVSMSNTTVSASEITISLDTSPLMTSRYHKEVDHSRDLLNDNNPKQALKYLLKLKEDIWSDAPKIIKFRLLTNIGSANLALGEDDKASKLFIEALSYNVKDEKALCNAALGYIIAGNKEQALKLIDDVLKNNPNYVYAYTLKIRILARTEDLEDIIEKIPEQFNSKPDVAYEIGHTAYSSDRLSLAEKWLQIAIDNDDRKTPDTRVMLGQVIIMRSVKGQQLVFAEQFDSDTKDRVNHAISLITEGLEMIAGTDMQELRADWIAARSFGKKLLGGSNEAISDIEDALRIDPKNTNYLIQRATLAFEEQDNSKAIAILEAIEDEEHPEIDFLLALAQRQTDPKKAIINTTLYINSNPPLHLAEEAKRSLVRLNIDIADIPEAEKIIGELKASDPTSILNAIAAAELFLYQRDFDKAIALLQEAKNFINESTDNRELVELGNRFYELGQYGDAAYIYKQFVDTNVDSILTRSLLHSYYQIGSLEAALKICTALQKHYGHLQYVKEIESAIYEEKGDLPKAKKICQAYLKQSPNDIRMRIRLAVINLRLNRVEDVDKFLKTDIEIKDLSADTCFRLAGLYAARSFSRQAIDLLYETRRRFYDDNNAHLHYVGMAIKLEKEDSDWIKTETVDVGTAVHVSEGNTTKWYILEDRDNSDIDIQRGEINTKHTLAQKLIGKKVGDKIVLNKDPIKDSELEIIDIKSKYSYAANASLQFYEQLFPDKKGLKKIPVDLSKEENGLPDGMQVMLDHVSRQQRRYIQVKDFYIKGGITIGGVAALLGTDIFETFTLLSSDPQTGIKCSLGSREEKREALLVMEQKRHLVLDSISLITVYNLDISDILTSVFGNLGITQSTMDLISQAHIDIEMKQNKDYTVLGKNHNKFIKQEVSKADLKQQLEFIESFQQWTTKVLDVIPLENVVDIHRQIKSDLDKMLGKSFVDTVLLSTNRNYVLYSDDMKLRQQAATDFGIEGVWTQPLLTFCRDIKALEREDYNKLIIELSNSNYYHTSIDKFVLLEAAKQANWIPANPFLSVSRLLQGNYSNISGIDLAAKFTYELWRSPILPSQRRQIILNLLDNITRNRDPKFALERFENTIKQCSIVIIPTVEDEVASLIKTWLKIHLV